MPALAKRKAEQALAAVVKYYDQYLTEQPYEAQPAATIDGVDYPATPAGVDKPLYPMPQLIKGWYDDRNWCVVWEEGPWEWALRATMGGYNEVADQVAAMGGTPVPEEPIGMPRGVFAEPVNSFVLGLYPA